MSDLGYLRFKLLPRFSKFRLRPLAVYLEQSFEYSDVPSNQK
jgi:hypothetical protein